MSSCAQEKKAASKVPPNVIIIFCDDMGYGDLACYGSKKHRTPNIDQMAKDGMLFTDFYVSSGVCTPSRASLMTGCYAQRVDLHVSSPPRGQPSRQVLFPRAKKGLNPSEITLAEILKEKGYATACIGKWHLGDQAQFLPTKQGFDYYFGIPYSNDMNRDFCPLPLLKNEEVIEAPVGQNTLTKRYTEETINFIKENKDQPFFVYLPHAMPHNPVHASEAFEGKSANGTYGDAIEEIDWSTGEILKYLKENNLDQNTLVIFTSDNGAAKKFGGSNLPLSGFKASTMEGGMRVPCIMQWNGTIPNNSRYEQMIASIDILPTICSIVEADVPQDRTIDGKNVSAILQDPSQNSPREYYNYYCLEQLQAIRYKDWKLHLPNDTTYLRISRGTYTGGRDLKLVNLRDDIQEQNDVSQNHPEIVEQLLKVADSIKIELGDIFSEGKEIRPTKQVENPVPLLLKN